MSAKFPIAIDRAARTPLAAQIHHAISHAIREGRLTAGARLPSWRDLAAQLGVARGTVRAAYEKLADEQLIIGMGAAGTRVVAAAAQLPMLDIASEASPLPSLYPDFERPPVSFQMGIPAQDGFPASLWSRLAVRAARAAAAAPVSYPDPRGHPDLRREIAAHLAIARGIQCSPGQILVTAGFSGALGLILHALKLHGCSAWLEDPAFPLTRTALNFAGIGIAPVPVDAHGLDVAEGIRRAPAAVLAVVTPGQQAPLGVTMSLERRLHLLDWARQANAWIVEDDYLSDLQLKGRAAPALASLDRYARVLHVGSFSKTISPALRLGFIMAPPRLAPHLGAVAASLAPAPAASIQRAVAAFMAEGHYLRHLRHMKRLYSARRDALMHTLGERLGAGMSLHASGGLALRLELLPEIKDTNIATGALPFGLAPVPLSPWYAAERRAGLLLGISNQNQKRLGTDCDRLIGLIGQYG